MSSQDDIALRRVACRERFGAAFDRLAETLYRHDPVGVADAGAPPEEYEPQAETILPRLPECKNVGDVQRVIHEEFVSWFTAEIAGPLERYRQLAYEVWFKFGTSE